MHWLVVLVENPSKINAKRYPSPANTESLKDYLWGSHRTTGHEEKGERKDEGGGGEKSGGETGDDEPDW